MIFKRFLALGIAEPSEEKVDTDLEGEVVGIDLGEKIYHLGAIKEKGRYIVVKNGSKFRECEISIKQDNVIRFKNIGFQLNGFFRPGKSLNLKISNQNIEATIKKLEWNSNPISKLTVLIKD